MADDCTIGQRGAGKLTKRLSVLSARGVGFGEVGRDPDRAQRDLISNVICF
jgi:hypothetical protein